MSKKNWIKIVGFLATAVTFGASLVTDWVDDKKTDEKIRDSVKKILSETKQS